MAAFRVKYINSIRASLTEDPPSSILWWIRQKNRSGKILPMGVTALTPSCFTSGLSCTGIKGRLKPSGWCHLWTLTNNANLTWPIFSSPHSNDGFRPTLLSFEMNWQSSYHEVCPKVVVPWIALSNYFCSHGPSTMIFKRKMRIERVRQQPDKSAVKLLQKLSVVWKAEMTEHGFWGIMLFGWSFWCLKIKFSLL